jgi:hypothetical protein
VQPQRLPQHQRQVGGQQGDLMGSRWDDWNHFLGRSLDYVDCRTDWFANWYLGNYCSQRRKCESRIPERVMFAVTTESISIELLCFLVVCYDRLRYMKLF